MMRYIVAALLIVAAGCATAPAKVAPASALAGAPAYRAADIEAKTAAELDALFGAPALTRIEGDGEFRRYALAGCSLVVILFKDETGERRMRHADAAALVAGEEKPPLADCLAAGLGSGAPAR